MKALITAISILVAGALAGAPAFAQSQRPRIGELATFTFVRGSADFVVRADEPSATEIGEIAAWAQENPEGLLVLDGHADRKGSAPANVRISLDRAKAVRNKLLEAGIDPAQILIAAYGEKHAGENTRDRKVVVWGTRSGMPAVLQRAKAKGRVVLTYLELDRRPRQVARQ
jgi:outer membrane protein OmpA-like peptidoglycan-associated protein